MDKNDKGIFLTRPTLYRSGTDVWLDADLILKSQFSGRITVGKEIFPRVPTTSLELSQRNPYAEARMDPVDNASNS